jgi:hypothetical protein
MENIFVIGEKSSNKKMIYNDLDDAADYVFSVVERLTVPGANSDNCCFRAELRAMANRLREIQISFSEVK